MIASFQPSVQLPFLSFTMALPAHFLLPQHCAYILQASTVKFYSVNTSLLVRQWCNACRGDSRTTVHAAAADNKELSQMRPQSVHSITISPHPLAPAHQQRFRANSSSRHSRAAHTPRHLPTRPSAGCHDCSADAARQNSEQQNTATSVWPAGRVASASGC